MMIGNPFDVKILIAFQEKKNKCFVILATVHLDTDENISKENFIKLNNIEVQDSGTSEQDLWNGLNSIGFNNSLEIDMVGLKYFIFLLYLLFLLFKDVPI